MKDETFAGRRPTDPGARLPYPIHQVVGAVADPEPVVAALIDAGFAAESLNILTGDADARRMHDTGEGGGVGGWWRRFGLGLGGDLDHLRQAEEELTAGKTLVGVVVHGDEARDLGVGVLRRHGAATITHYERWTIETVLPRA
jgi:hypothetical protein